MFMYNICMQIFIHIMTSLAYRSMYMEKWFIDILYGFKYIEKSMVFLGRKTQTLKTFILLRLTNLTQSLFL